jgi:hypothetical protein
MNIPQLLNLRYGSGPHDLRDHAPGAGNIYPVDPAAVERFKRITAEREREQKQRQQTLAIRSQAQKKRRRKRRPSAVKPASPAKENKSMNLQAVHKRYMAGESIRTLASENGMAWQTLMSDFKAAGLPKRPKIGASKKNGTAPAAPEPVPTPAPTPPPEETAVPAKAAHKPAPDVDELIHNAVEETARRQSVISATPPVGLPDWLRRDALPPARPQPNGLASLVELLKDESVEVEGEIKLNLSIRINKKPAVG